MIRIMSANDALVRGRLAFDREAWSDACRELGAADVHAPLDPDDLDRLATAAYLIGEDAASADARARAHAGFLERGDPIRAARSAFWMAFALFDRPANRAQAGGWLARARRLLDECGRDCVEQGFLLCALGFQRVSEGEAEPALAAFEEAAAIGTRFRDPDVTALARHGQARCLIRLNRAADGFALLDEVMVAVTGGEVTAMIAGVVYCSVMSACYEAFDLRRAQEWTTALAGWCAAHPDMVPFRAQCMIRRAELLQLHGDWREASAEVQRATDWCARTQSSPEAGAACYQQGELHRLQGDFARAEECYRRASQAGRKPYPGFPGGVYAVFEGHWLTPSCFPAKTTGRGTNRRCRSGAGTRARGGESNLERGLKPMRARPELRPVRIHARIEISSRNPTCPPAPQAGDSASWLSTRRVGEPGS